MMTSTTVRSARLSLLLGAALLLAGCAGLLPRGELTPRQRRLNLESFDRVWTTVRDRHFDPGIGGLDWPGVYDELRPRIARASTMRQARAAMQEMLDRLELTHFSIIPAAIYSELVRDDGQGFGDGTVGLEVRLIDGRAVVTRVDGQSPSDRSGVHPGWVVSAIEGDTVATLLRSIYENFDPGLERDYIAASAVMYRLDGPVGDTISVTFLDNQDNEVGLELPMVPVEGEIYQFGYMPPFRVQIKVDTLAGSVRCIRFNAFLDPPRLMPVFNTVLQSMDDASGLIIDLRGNAGGLGVIAMGMAGWLVGETGHSLGTVYTRDTRLKLVVNPRANPYTGPVAVLVDGLSVSCAEFLSGGLQDLGRAAVIGSPTLGAALSSNVEPLPNGDRFQYAFADFIRLDGSSLEGLGVTPDITVQPTRRDYLAHGDPVLRAALSWIEKQNQ
ncbi:S41 family peptidase [Candidatus Neomarinimicrobiota bacterium]